MKAFFSLLMCLMWQKTKKDHFFQIWFQKKLSCISLYISNTCLYVVNCKLSTKSRASFVNNFEQIRHKLSYKGHFFSNDIPWPNRLDKKPQLSLTFPDYRSLCWYIDDFYLGKVNKMPIISESSVFVRSVGLTIIIWEKVTFKPSK